ncbi:hypothetical protein EXIGLDRAFT_841010 [Exidia glandulosa HHB12029]|uniref:CFEM domain-containing protein n=1 Tax=Exidia glandulosa HHB12029 TaxID=1314781 RepID=A0A165E5G3_EXIGL|nr:hypothetical protein EXIGLDRAFT_841010 [Exidia glandulosa HHB12029]
MLDVHGLSRRLIVARVDSRSATNDNSQACIQSCLQSAAVASSCTDATCICSSTTFHDTALQCLNTSCGGLDYTSALDSVLSSCATGGLDGIASYTNSLSSVYGSYLTGAGTQTRPLTSASSTGSRDDGGSKVPIGAIVGGVVGGLVLIALFVGLIFFLVRRNRRRQQQEPHPQTAYSNVPPQNMHEGKPPVTSGYPAPAMGYTQQNGYGTSRYSGPTTTSASSNAGNLGYVPPQQFAMYPSNPDPSPPPPPQTQNNFHTGGFVVPPQPQQQQFDPYAQYDPRASMSMSTSQYSSSAATAVVTPPTGDVKRPLNVMSAESSGAGVGDAPPPVYRQ